jgi:hypothetical protein
MGSQRDSAQLLNDFMAQAMAESFSQPGQKKPATASAEALRLLPQIVFTDDEEDQRTPPDRGVKHPFS